MSREQSRVSWLAVCGILFGLVAASATQAATEKQIDEARRKGIEHIKSQQKEDGSWEFPGHPVGITALCTIALIQNGVPISDPVVQKGYQYVLANTQDLTQTYDLALAIVLLSNIDARANRRTIRILAGRLLAGQLSSGGWSYSCPKEAAPVSGSRRRRRSLKPGGGDNSNTQFAVLGLWTAARSGVVIDDAMALVVKRFVSSQNEDGGWPYRHPTEQKAEPSRDAMTFAGLFCLTVARATQLKKELQQQQGPRTDEGGQRIDEGKTLMSFPVFAKGLERAGKYVKGGSAARYYLWSVERLGVILGLDHFGDVNWFDKGADLLLKAQGKDGAWKDARGTLAETAFAILFLRKANLGSDITRLLSGDPEKPFQITTQKGKPRFDELLQAIKASKPNDVIRVDSDGPLKMPHVEFTHNLKIQAGFGYTPVFQYDRGVNRLGLPGSPMMDPETRYLLRVSSGTLTLEGLKLEMEPPYGRKVPWSAVRVDGGRLQMLNCTLTEGGGYGMPMIDIRAPSRVLLRNCLIVGGRAAIEVQAKGKQEIELDNSVLFTETGIDIVPPEKKGPEAAISLNLSHSTFQTVKALSIGVRSAKVEVRSEKCAYKTGTMLFAGFSPFEPVGRSFTGSGNLYDVSRWIRAKGTLAMDVPDLDAWVRFWGEKEEDSFSMAIGFRIRRMHGSYVHRVFGEDWNFSEDMNVPSQYADAGAHGSLVGAGQSYSNFRDSFHYTEWLAAAK